MRAYRLVNLGQNYSGAVNPQLGSMPVINLGAAPPGGSSTPPVSAEDWVNMSKDMQDRLWKRMNVRQQANLYKAVADYYKKKGDTENEDWYRQAAHTMAILFGGERWYPPPPERKKCPLKETPSGG